jgi:hypothetical protein
LARAPDPRLKLTSQASPSSPLSRKPSGRDDSVVGVRRPGVQSNTDLPSPEVSRQTIKIVHWQDGDAVLGYLLDYPDYWTQGESLDDLTDHLIDLNGDLTSGELPGIRKVDELVLP